MKYYGKLFQIKWCIIYIFKLEYNEKECSSKVKASAHTRVKFNRIIILNNNSL